MCSSEKQDLNSIIKEIRKLKEELKENNSNSGDREIIRDKILSLEEDQRFFKFLHDSGVGIEFITANINDFKEDSVIESAIIMFPKIEGESIKDRKKPLKFDLFPVIEKICDSYEKNIDNGIGIILTGPVGIGKTHLAVAIMAEYMKRRPYESLFGVKRARTCGFVSVFDLIATAENRSFDSAKKFEDIRKKDILIIDEMCAEESFSHDSANIIINRVIRDRYNDQKMTIITSNASIEIFFRMYGERGSSILLGNKYHYFVLNGSDRRFLDE